MCYNAIKEVGSTLSNLTIIEALSQLVEEQSSIICLLSLTLAEAGVYCEDIDQMILDATPNTPPSSVLTKHPTIYHRPRDGQRPRS